MLAPNDPFDPNTWQLSEHEFRIYGDDKAQTWGTLDEEDYLWAVRWRWCWKKSRCGSMYLRRAVGENANGLRLRTYTLYLHVEIAKRAGLPRPTQHHKIVDHRDGNSMNNTRTNLRWVTVTMNAFNTYGRRGADLIEG